MIHKLSFGALNPKERYKEIRQDVNDFLENDTNTVKADNVAKNLWHLVEWVFHMYKESHDCDISLGDFRNKLIKDCPDLNILCDIANHSKHCKLTRRLKSNTKEARSTGSFNNDYSFDFDIHRLVIVFTNKDERDFTDIVYSVVKFWDNYFDLNE